ncbi:hypothetical protein GIB67_030781 [Kingdonia uniflora]|uniref:Uncharacterized protein n=1 Tax=Kingdonia uniflora TaxID=39325 RepID=A0A7J7L363_9MAGN|nr:hypothetical protein GIB67_030781 [Kingdonia uniflora]
MGKSKLQTSIQETNVIVLSGKDNEVNKARPLMNALVKVFCVHSGPNFSLPWWQKRQCSLTSIGFIIKGQRILTNAHSVINYTQVKVRKHGSDTKYLANVLIIGNECDIAMLTVKDDELWEGILPAEFGSLPVLHDVIVIFEEEKNSSVAYHLGLLSFGEDVLSFELDLACIECHVEGDTSSLWHIAKAIHKLKFSFGVIPNVTAKGKRSTRVAEILNSMQEKEPVNSSDMGTPEISTVILLDREILSINNGSVELEASIMGGQKDGKKIKVPLNSSIIHIGLKHMVILEYLSSYVHFNDKLFKEIRDLNFEVAVQALRQKVKSMKPDYSEMSTVS